ncbi:unnamed protein product [Hydatigera taeniaeformis]|uniref:Gem-associated protein 2 n=1 Tax=Hydatigena taeniaeformis TaxID=6205 RepID=A0A0R3X5R3_HYDTA|nr:unnamed protein product [Hydatigera taeniaeformis]
MEDLAKDVIYFARILRSLCIEEQKIEGLCRDIQSSYKRSFVKVEKEDDKVEVEEEVPESLVREIENALSKARLALENSELRAEKSSKPPKRPVDASCVGKRVSKTSTVTEKGKSKPQKQVVSRAIASGSKNRNPTTTKHRPRGDRTVSNYDSRRTLMHSYLGWYFGDCSVNYCHSFSDWSVATPGQHQWRNQMLENFVALFNIAMHFKPILLGDENTAVKIANPPKQKDFAPSMETIWRAYVCSGQKVPSYTDPPIEIPSRAFRLTLGPAVFSNHPEVYRDFQQMVGLWSDILHLQRRLQCLDYIESRLPHWLRLIAEQPTEKASTLRLLCQIACDCYPVTIERE